MLLLPLLRRTTQLAQWPSASFIGIVSFTGWSLVGNNLSKIIPIKVLFKQIHTKKVQMIGNNRFFKLIYTNKAATDKGTSPCES